MPVLDDNVARAWVFSHLTDCLGGDLYDYLRGSGMSQEVQDALNAMGDAVQTWLENQATELDPGGRRRRLEHDRD